MKGLFISVEGTDGSGKSTQIDLMSAYLIERKFDVVVTREPGSTEVGEQIRNILLDKANIGMDSMAELLLYFAARAQLLAKVIKPAVAAGSIVICDRFADSSLVYQGLGRSIGIEKVSKLADLVLDGYWPDMTLFFDLPPEIALSRRTLSTEPDRIEIEKIEFHQRVYNGYKYIADKFPERIRVIDSKGTIDQVFEIVKTNIDLLMQKYK